VRRRSLFWILLELDRDMELADQVDILRLRRELDLALDREPGLNSGIATFRQQDMGASRLSIVERYYSQQKFRVQSGQQMG
jgi:hypothetical protein